MTAAAVFALAGLLSLAYWSEREIPIYGIYGAALWAVAGLCASGAIS